MTQDIAIVGGGICGLALAIHLHRQGIAAHVFEAAPEIRELGVGITLLPHAVRELASLGLLDQIEAAGIENRESAFFNRFGQKLFGEPRGRHAGYPFPEYGIHRGRLHTILYLAAKAELGDRIHLDHRLTGLEQDASGVSLSFETTSSAQPLPPFRASAAIGCDGINSAVRKQFYPAETVAYTGINTWRGVTRRKPILDGRTYLRIGSILTGKIVIYPIVDDVDGLGDGSGDQLINWIAEIQKGASTRNDWNTAGRREDFLPIYESFKFDWLDVGALIRDADTILEYPMVDRDPVERWSFARVTLAGDAAHPMYPRGSNGSAQALIDARVLGERLAGGADPVSAFAAYEAERRPATTRIVETNRVSPPDVINLKVEELTGDRPFENLADFISQDELRALSDRYKVVAGFEQERVTAS